MVTCPWHKDGQENHPSCCVSNTSNDDKYEKGFFHCFTCGKHYSLPYVVTYCLGESDVSVGEEWLVERFGNTFVKKAFTLTDIELPTTKNNKNKS